MDKLTKMRSDALEIFNASIKAVDPVTGVKQYLSKDKNTISISKNKYRLDDFNNIYLIGFGKAAASMAKGVEQVIGNCLTSGIVIVKYGHLDSLSSKIKIIEAAHPVPDKSGIEGAKEIVEFVSTKTEKDLIVCVISGGGSALFPLPAENISLKEKQKTTELLLSCGADIKEINTVRKHISQVKGGQLARLAQPATLATLVLSDVIGDPLDSIASGPTVPDSSTYQDCMAIFQKYELSNQIPDSVINHINAGLENNIVDTPQKNDPAFSKTYNIIVGNNLEAVVAAKKCAEELGYNVLILSTLIEGETKDVAYVHAAIAKEIVKSGNPIQKPACIISGGETTVTIKGKGLGGRNQEFVLAAATEIHNFGNIVILSAGTDGTDGPTDAAGAIADQFTILRATELKVNAKKYLKNNDSYNFFKKLNDLIITGPTNTNVMDIRIMLIR